MTNVPTSPCVCGETDWMLSLGPSHKGKYYCRNCGEIYLGGERMTEDNLRDADCCYFCRHRGILYGHFSDAVECAKLCNEHDSPIHVRHVQICDKFGGDRRMTDTKFCPLMRDIDGRILKCFGKACAWWVLEKCAIEDIALSLDQLRIKVNQYDF